MLDLTSLMKPVIEIAKIAGTAINSLYQHTKEIQIILKENQTPQIEADRVAHQLIIQGLKKLTPDIPILSEESAEIADDVRLSWHTYWLVDPLDGTKEFINHTDEFTVNIALIEQHKPILGVIYVPIFDVVYYAAENQGAFKQENNDVAVPIQSRKNLKSESDLVIVTSRRHGQESIKKFLGQVAKYQVIQKGSSLKSCWVAEGKADLYPCLGPTSEWDMAAAQCIVEQAGGSVIDRKFQPLRYNVKSSLSNPQLLIIGDPEYNWRQYWQSK